MNNFSSVEIMNCYSDYIDSQKLSLSTRKRRKAIAKRYLIVHYPTKRAGETEHACLHRFMATLNYLKPSTYNVYITDLKYLFLYMERYHQYPCILYLMRPKNVPQYLPRNIPLHLMKQLCTVQSKEKQLRLSLRNQAIVEFLFSTGVRNCEARAVRICDLSDDLSECRIKTAKGGKNRIVYLGEPAIQAVQRYLSQRGINHKNNKHKNFLLFVSKRGKALDTSALKRIICKLAAQRVNCHITPHMIRHTFATEMLRATGRLRSVQELLGHVSINNTARYCHLEFRDKLNAVNTYHPNSIKLTKKS